MFGAFENNGVHRISPCVNLLHRYVAKRISFQNTNRLFTAAAALSILAAGEFMFDLAVDNQNRDVRIGKRDLLKGLILTVQQ